MKNIIILKWHHARHAVQESLKELARENWRDYAYWPDGKTKQSYGDYIEQSFINTFYDSLDLDEWKEAKEAVGDVFFTEEEARKVHEYAKFFHEAGDIVYYIDENGEDASDEQIESDPNWPEVRRKAKGLYDYLKENDKKYKIEESWKHDGTI